MALAIAILVGLGLAGAWMAVGGRRTAAAMLTAAAIALGGLTVANAPVVGPLLDLDRPPAAAGELDGPDASILPRGASQPDTGMRVVIPKLGVNARVLELGLNPDRSLQVPKDFDHAGWWRGGARPGDEGPAVIVGHLASTAGPAVFRDLNRLEPGDEVAVTRPDGSASGFVITGAAQHAKADFPTDEVYGEVPHEGLRLITCAGPFDSATGHYRDNYIVYARRATA